jgi:fibronectin type 3 domain-containing protein
MNLETDLAAYRVYRSDEEGKQGQLLESFWIGPSYRDNAIASGHRYWYTVTALDRAGNESQPSAPFLVFVQAEQCQQ